MNEETRTRLRELLADKHSGGLDADGEIELAALESEAGFGAEAAEFELAAAAVALSELGPVEKLPGHVEWHIREDYLRFSAEAGKGVSSGGGEGDRRRGPARFPLLGWLGWAIAVAACLALALNVYVLRSPDGRAQAGTSAATPTPPASLEESRESLIASSSDLTQAVWGKGNVEAAAGVSGDVVWSDDKQTGYLRLTGLPVNDANQETYQLWIFDETQSEKTPIDGGVFNVTAGGEVIIPIDAKLHAKDPKAFAVTIEKPGGVVVSDRKRIAAFAQVKPAPA